MKPLKQFLQYFLYLPLSDCASKCQVNPSFYTQPHPNSHIHYFSECVGLLSRVNALDKNFQFSILDLISQSPEKIQDLDLLTRKNSVIFKQQQTSKHLERTLDVGGYFFYCGMFFLLIRLFSTQKALKVYHFDSLVEFIYLLSCCDKFIW